MLTLPITIERLFAFVVSVRSSINKFALSMERSLVLAVDKIESVDEARDDSRPRLFFFTFVTIVSRNSSTVEILERIRFRKLKLFSALLLCSSSLSDSKLCLDILQFSN